MKTYTGDIINIKTKAVIKLVAKAPLTLRAINLQAQNNHMFMGITKNDTKENTILQIPNSTILNFLATITTKTTDNISL